MPDILVRPFDIAIDLQKAIDLRLEALKSDQRAFRRSLEEESSRTLDQWKDRFRPTEENMFILALRGEEAIGMIGAKQRPGELGAWSLNSVYVRKEYREQHIASRLFGVIENAIKQRGGKRFKFQVNSDQQPAVAFYERMGCKQSGSERDSQGDGVEYTKLIMEKNL